MYAAAGIRVDSTTPFEGDFGDHIRYEVSFGERLSDTPFSPSLKRAVIMISCLGGRQHDLHNGAYTRRTDAHEMYRARSVFGLFDRVKQGRLVALEEDEAKAGQYLLSRCRVAERSRSPEIITSFVHDQVSSRRDSVAFF